MVFSHACTLNFAAVKKTVHGPKFFVHGAKFISQACTKNFGPTELIVHAPMLIVHGCEMKLAAPMLIVHAAMFNIGR